jgi:nucleoside permease NupC
MIRPFLKDMTHSELHAVMTGGFATIAGSVLGAYISFGVSYTHKFLYPIDLCFVNVASPIVFIFPCIRITDFQNIQ